MEKDDEMKGAGNSYDFGARIYDPRLGYFLSIDPLTRKYASQSPYVYAANSPLRYIDLHGMGPADAAKSGMSAAVAAASKKSGQASNSGSGNANAKQPKSATQWVKTISTNANQKSQTASNNTASNNTANNSSGNSSQSLSQRVTEIVTEGSANQQSANEQPGAGPIQSDESNQTESKEAVEPTNPIDPDVSAGINIAGQIFGDAFEAGATGEAGTIYKTRTPQANPQVYKTAAKFVAVGGGIFSTVDNIWTGVDNFREGDYVKGTVNTVEGVGYGACTVGLFTPAAPAAAVGLLVLGAVDLFEWMIGW